MTRSPINLFTHQPLFPFFFFFKRTHQPLELRKSLISAGTKIIFTNGSQDPWRHASKQTSSPDRESPHALRIIFSLSEFESILYAVLKCLFNFSVPSYIITCHNCGHGTDLRGCPQSPLNLEGTIDRIRKFFVSQSNLTINMLIIIG